MNTIKKTIIVVFFSLSGWDLYSQVPLMDIEFESFILSPLNSKLVALDFKTVTENKTYLRSIMGWGDWPSDALTMESDARALSKHYEEFKQQKALLFLY